MQEPEAGQESEPRENPEAEKYIYPFTGIETDALPKERAVAVMINNQIQARPQSSLSKADIVYEALTEGNITRFMAIYHSNPPDSVGPVRSAREYYFTLAQGYNAIYIYSGAANFVNDMIRERGIDHIEGGHYDNDGHLIIRETFRKAPHNMYLQYGAVHEVAAEKGYDVEAVHEPLLFTDKDAEIAGEAANYVRINYYSTTPYVEYKYDPETMKYRRFNDGEKTVELATEEEIQIDNLFIVETDHAIIDDVGRRKLDLDSGGKAYLLQHGKVQEVEWGNRDGRILPIKDGKVLPFVPGNTWVNFVQTVPTSGVKEQVIISNE